MSTASDHIRHEAWPWLYHQGWKITITGCVINVIPFGGLWPSLLGLALIISGFYLGYVHDRMLCERCIANWPLDPQAEVRRYSRSLRFTHWVQDFFAGPRRVRVWKLIGFSVLVFVWVAVKDHVFPDWLHTFFTILTGAVLLPLAFISTSRHQRLQPWCPQCHPGGGGGTFSPDPAPHPRIKAPR